MEKNVVYASFHSLFPVFNLIQNSKEIDTKVIVGGKVTEVAVQLKTEMKAKGRLWDQLNQQQQPQHHLV